MVAYSTLPTLHQNDVENPVASPGPAPAPGALRPGSGADVVSPEGVARAPPPGRASKVIPIEMTGSSRTNDSNH